MVLRRSYAKLKDAKGPPRQQVQKRATKVHAQRKFAQGAGLTNSPPAMTSPVREKDKPKMNGTGGSPAPVSSAKRPRTEDFITFLCFRGTDKLPPELNYFNTPSKPDKNERDSNCAGSSKHSLNNSQESPKTKGKVNVASGTRQGRPPVVPLKTKIRDKRIAAQQKLALMRTSAVLRARQRTLPTEHPKKSKTTALSGKLNRPAHTTRSSHPSILKRLGSSRARAGLRSAGQLPQGSEDGIKTDRKPKENVDTKTGKKALPKKGGQKVTKNESDGSPEKSGRMATRSKKIPQSPPKTLNVASRPSRKTKEAATLYMEIINKDLRSPDEEDVGVSIGKDDSTKEDKLISNDRKTRGATSKLPVAVPSPSGSVKSSKRDSITSPATPAVKEKLKRKESVSEEHPSDKKRASPRKQSEEENKKPDTSGFSVPRRTRSNTLLESEDDSPSPPSVRSLQTKPKPPKKTDKSDNSQGKAAKTAKKVKTSIEVESSQETDKEKTLTRSKSQRKAQNDSEEESSRPKSPAKKSQPAKLDNKAVRVTRSSTVDEDQPERAKKSVKRKSEEGQEVTKRTRRSKKIETESEEEVKEQEEKEKDKAAKKMKSVERKAIGQAKMEKKAQNLVKSSEEATRRGRSSKKLEADGTLKDNSVVGVVDSKKKKVEVELKKEGKGRKKGKESSEESEEDSSSEKDSKQNEKPKELANIKKSKKMPVKVEESNRSARKPRKAKPETDDSESEDVSYSRRSSRRVPMTYNEDSDSTEEEIIPERPKRSSRAVVHLYDVNSDSEEDFLTDNDLEYEEATKEEPAVSKPKKTKKAQGVEEENIEASEHQTADTEQKKMKETALPESKPKHLKVETSQTEEEKQEMSQAKVDTKKVLSVVEGETQVGSENETSEKNTPATVNEDPPRTRRRVSREERPTTPVAPGSSSSVAFPAPAPTEQDVPVEQAETAALKKGETKVEASPDVAKDGSYNDLDTLAAAASLISLQTRKVILSSTRKSSTETRNQPTDKPKGPVEEKKEGKEAPLPNADSDASTDSSGNESRVTRRKRLSRRLRREPVRLQPPNRPVRNRRAKLTDSYLIDEDSFSSDRSSSPEVMPSSNKRQISKLLKKSEESHDRPAVPAQKPAAPERIELPKPSSSNVQPPPFDPPIPVGRNHPRQRATPLPARSDQIDAVEPRGKEIFRKRPQGAEFDPLKTSLFNIKSISDNANVLATADIKSKPSIGDTWIQAFKNVKIPKPGQLSPAHSSSPPFVRKPFPQTCAKPEDLRRHVQPFPSTSSRLPNFQTLRVGHLQNSGSPPKNGNQSPNRFSPGQTSPSRPSPASASADRKNVDLTPSKAPEELKIEAPVPSKTLTHLQYEKRSQDFISSLKDAALASNKYRILKPSGKDLSSRTSSPSLEETSKPIPEAGKHLNLPPVEHTLRKMSPITVSKKPLRVDKKSSPAPEVKPSTVSKVEIKPVTSLEILNKMRVNMTHQEINGWMNDSTSSGIEHARDCGIFENNQCGCSFRTSGDSMRNSVSVTGLIVKDETKVDHGVVEPPVQLKELDVGNNKFTAETISTCKVDDYKEKIMSKSHSSTVEKKEAATQRGHKLQTKIPLKRKPSMTEEEMCGFDFRFERGSYSRESGSDMSSPTPRDDVSVSNDENPNYSGGVERKAIFHQRRMHMVASPGGSGAAKRPPPSKSPSAFSAENESSVYAFEPDPPPPLSSIKQPFRRRGSRHKSNEEEPVASSSIAVQVNFETEKVLECSTQTEQVENEGQLFYFPIEAESSPTQVIQGVQLKLQSAEGPDQRVFMKAKLVTKPSPTFPKPSSSRPLTQKPEQKVRPLASTSNKLPVGAVQPTVRDPVPPAQFTSQGTTTSPQLANQSTQSSRPSSPPPGSIGSSKPLDLASKGTSTVPSITSSPAPTTSSTFESSPCTVGVVQPPSKVSTKSSKMKTPASTFPRPGLSSPTVFDAPTFYPTEKEFQDPLEYIEQITPLAKSYGMCRIIPPSSFKPECKVSDDMRFTAYNQYVHKMLHRWGPNVREMSAIKKYLATQSIALKQLPWIGGMEVDLPRLYQTVQMCGGLKEVIEKKRWAKVADAMKIPKSAQDRVTKLDDIYCKFLLPYDTLSHDERSKLLKEVDIEWEARERRLEDEAERETDDSESESDSDDRDECITKGKTMPLSGFYRIARNTMAMWFKETSPGAREVEAEYWKHVTTGNSHICVNAGSIDTGTMGFGFPTSKTSSTSRHPWNLKVLTNNSGSILRSIGPVIGVTVPTLHVGMLFSACCWYRDPHGLPWVEYLHTGANKIWYCVPDSWNEQLRTCLKRLLPRYCVDKPIWLASDTAMVPPDIMNQHGVSLCRTVQEPGQFILVFPKAFTSTVCTGYVVSESVYFAQPSWLATAKSIFKDIQESCEPPVFSLEKLLFNIVSDSRSSLEVLNQVLPMIFELKESEVNQRKKIKELGLAQAEKLPAPKGRKRSQEEVEFECEICRGNLFLSMVREEKPNSDDEELNYCLVHAAEILEKDKSVLEHWKLMVTYEEEEMNEVIDKLKMKIEQKTQKKLGKSASTTASKA